MKRWPVVILVILLVLGAVVLGCRHIPQYDSRLTAADSLMRTNPDSALALLESLNSSPARGEVARSDGGGGVDPAWGEVAHSDGGGGATLSTEADRAYYGLLLTQARYKAYVTATSDSDINRALDYYKKHPAEREKLTRAYIYKGAVMEELGHPDSAMLYYKTAEATASPDDYFNLGYVKLRIGELYQSQLSFDSIAIKRLKQSLNYFSTLQDTSYLIIVNGTLGSINSFVTKDSCKKYLNSAIYLAKKFNPPLQYTYKSKLAGIYFAEGNYQIANKLAMDVFNNGREESNDNQFYYYAAFTFIEFNKIDSALHIMSETPKPVNAVDTLNHYDLLAQLAKKQNDGKTYGKYNALSREITSQILLSSKENSLLKSEMDLDQIKLKDANTSISNKNLIILIILILISIASIFILKLVYDIRASKKEKKLITDSLQAEIQRIKSQQENNSDSVSLLVRYRISALNELYQDIRIKSHDEKKTKRIIPLSSFLKTLNERQDILDINLSQSFWNKMERSVDGEYSGIMSFVRNKYPSLTELDLKLFCLSCAHLSPQIIKLCLNYSNAKTVSNYRIKLIKNKMGLDLSFEEFIQQYLSGKLG